MKRIRLIKVHILKKVIAYMAVLLCIMGSLLPITVHAANDRIDKGETVRVGFFARDGYHMIDEEGLRTGYGYEVLQLIARYSKLRYEYVGYDESRNDSLEMLRNGEIDILTSAHKTLERLDEFEFSEINIGFCSTMITTKAGNDRIEAGNYDTYEGIRIGLVEEDVHNESLLNFATEKGFSYTAVYYETVSQVIQALENGEVDATATGSIRVLSDGEWYLETFDEEPIYVIVHKENKELLNKINEALTSMDYHEADWRLRLLEEYYPKDKAEVLNFTQEEKEYLEGLQEEGIVLRVLANPDNYPYSYIEDGKYKGILIDLFDEMAGKINIDYELIMVENREDYMDVLASDFPDICLDFHQNYSMAENYGYCITDPYLTINYSMLYRSDYDGTITEVGRIAHTLERKEIAALGNADYVFYPSQAEAVEAVRSGEIQSIVINTFYAEKVVWEDERNELQTNLFSRVSSYNLGVANRADYKMVAIMNKAISSLDEEYVDGIARKYSQLEEKSFSFIRLFYEYPQFLGLFTVTMVLLLIFLIAHIMRRRYTRRLLVEIEAKEKADQAKNDFLSRMSHDIRTPLNGVIGMIEIAKRNINNKARVEECLDKMNISANHLQSLVNDVLDIAKIEMNNRPMRKEPFDIRLLLEHCTDIIQSRIGSRPLTFEYDYKSIQHPYLIGDELKVSEILINILGNSVKYTKDGGAVKFFVEEKTAESDEKTTFCFVIEDTGIGMSEEFLQRIYEPFEQEISAGRTEYMGTGLGMSIVKRLLDQMGGSMEIESTLGKGSKFIVHLTCEIDNTPRTEQAASSEDTETSCDLSGMKVLVVDDVELNLEIMQSILEDEGVTVVTATNGQEAIEMFEASPPESLHMILMDIRMPVLDGIEATKAIRSMEGRSDATTIPIIALSANAYDTDAEKSKAAGMNDHLSKPIDMALLVAKLASYKPKNKEK